MALKVFILLGLLPLFAADLKSVENESKPTESLHGHWRFIEVIYENERRPPFNINLVLRFEFQEDGTSKLYWERTGQSGFCERYGKYEWDGKVLIDEVKWVNPENQAGCGNDPDMQVGQKSYTPLSVVGDEMHLELSLSGKPLIYIWKKTDEPWPRKPAQGTNSKQLSK